MDVLEGKKLKALYLWLLFCCGAVFCMIIIGAITRLTGSGLSMVEWKPLMGALPPMSEAEWQRVFSLYQDSPEYKKVNFWMELSDFKQIFFWEWFHRLFGRLIGIFYALPFLVFWFLGYIPKEYRLKLLGLFFLGGAQGLMGWYMVKSGLVDNPAVSHFRLAAHLSLALVIYGVMFWLALTFKNMSATIHGKANQSVFRFGCVAMIFLIVTILWGAFTAGLDAGLVYNDSFPMMGGRWIPEEVFMHDPLWVSFIEDHAGVQFIHRWLAMSTMVVVISYTFFAMRRGYLQKCFIALGFFVFIQVGLGVATLLSGVSLHPAVAHQGGAVILLSLLIACLHYTYAPVRNGKH